MTDLVALDRLLSRVVDNRGKTCPTVDNGLPLIATNCVKNDGLFPTLEKVRYVSEETYREWFRGHPEPGDLIFVTKGAPGQVCLAPDPVSFCIAQDMVALRADSAEVYPPYLFAALRSPQVQNAIVNMHVGTMIPHFKKGDFDKLLIPRPGRERQQFIGDLYLLLSRKIDLNRRMRETLEAMARAIFKDWFVDFGPTRAKMEGRSPYFAAETWALFPNRLANEGKPEGWETRPLLDLCELKRGYDLPSQDRVTGEIPIVSSSGPTGWHNVAMAQKPGIVTGRYGTIGRVFTCHVDFWPLNTTLYVRDFKGHPFWFVYHVLSGLAFSKFTDKAAVPGINRNDLHREPVTFPTAELIAAFNAIASPLMTKVRSNDAESQLLVSLRDLLIPKLMSGEISLRDAEKMVEAAA